QCCAHLGCPAPGFNQEPFPDAFTCQTGCGAQNERCNYDTDCCSGLKCDVGVCVSVCVPLEGACGPDLPECCDGAVCHGTICERCSGNALTCTKPDDCCPGLQCIGGVCTCTPRGSSCTGDGQCCLGMSCRSGKCDCTDLGQSCGSDADCCHGL